MSAQSNLPTNKNFLSPLGFSFSIKKTPNLNFFVQSAGIPGISMSVTQTPTPFAYLKDVGDKVTFNDLNITFRVDENLHNYVEIHNWIKNNSRYSFDGYKQEAASSDGIKSDATLIILSSSKNPIVEVSFINIFPTYLSEITFDSRLTDVNYIDAIATFSYQSYSIKHF